MRIYDVGNKAKVGFWCAAPDEDTAKDIALAAKHAKNRQALRVADVTEMFLKNDPNHHDLDSIHAILNGTTTGRVVGIGQSFRFEEILKAIDETGTGPKAAKTRWVVNGNE
jgi:hypothetical protein